MSWDDTRSQIIAECDVCVAPLGYKMVKSRDAFEKSSLTERRGIYIQLIATPHHNYSLSVWCGVRNNVIEERFHRTSGVDKKHHARYTTINRNSGNSWSLNSAIEIRVAIKHAKQFILETAIPFLEREYSYQDYCDLLNSNPSSHRSPYHGNAEDRCHYGVIAARMAADPRYEELKTIYTNFLRSTNKGFYYPRFAKLVADLES
jgi:hypothetical protein